MCDIRFGYGIHELEKSDDDYFRWAGEEYYLHINKSIKNIRLDIYSEISGYIDFSANKNIFLRKEINVGDTVVTADIPEGIENLKINQPFIIPSELYNTADFRKLSYKIYDVTVVYHSGEVKVFKVEEIKDQFLTDSVFDLDKLEIQIFKKFDGVNNYFNPSHLNGKTILRKEQKYENRVLISDIVDDQNNMVLEHCVDEKYVWSYEDARFINDREISVCCCKRDKHNLGNILNVEFKKYNLFTKEFTHFKTQNSHFEKHWQFYENFILYHVNPYVIMDLNENIIYKNKINWSEWIKKFGKPGLSTNVFTIDNENYVFFHSYITVDTLHFKYYIGLLKMDSQLRPIHYFEVPFFSATKSYTDTALLEDMWNWRKTDLQDAVKYEVIFPMNVVVDDENINIYSGLNDCSAVNIKINRNEFSDKLKNTPYILV